MTHLQQYLLMLEEAHIPYSLSDTVESRSVIVERGYNRFYVDTVFDLHTGKLVDIGAWE